MKYDGGDTKAGLKPTLRLHFPLNCNSGVLGCGQDSLDRGGCVARRWGKVELHNPKRKSLSYLNFMLSKIILNIVSVFSHNLNLSNIQKDCT